jgi:PAB-dependent poly(A)-specific ribonuclease subunit 3
MTSEKSSRRSRKPRVKSCRVSFSESNDSLRLTSAAAGLPRLDKEKYHSLVPLDTNNNKSAAVFGFPSWAYKAQKEDGNYYVLRRLEGSYLGGQMIYHL